MRRKQTLALVAALVCMAIGMVFTSCGGDDDDWWDLEQGLAGEWATDTWTGTDASDIVQYVFVAEKAGEKGSMHPYVIYGVRKDSQQVTKEAGYFGHPNGEANDVLDFRDYLNSKQEYRTVKWTDNAHTTMTFYGDYVFRKRK